MSEGSPERLREALRHVCGEGANLGEIYHGHFMIAIANHDGQQHIAFCHEAWNDVTVRVMFPPGMGKFVPPIPFTAAGD